MINRFCIRKSLAGKFRNRFVVSHFLYFAVNFLFLVPFYISSAVWMILEENEKDEYKERINIAVLAMLTQGFAMFFVRLSETSSNWKISLKKFIFSAKTEDKILFDPDQPLTAIINKTMNLEFMCCILNGLSQISRKSDRKIAEKESKNMTISVSKVITQTESNVSTVQSRFQRTRIDKKRKPG